MRLEKYESSANKAKTIFTFISEGPKGKIVKQIQYTKLGFTKNLYNLAFGDLIIGTNDIDDLSVTDNQDRNKVLATVVSTIYEFTTQHPKAKIFFAGSTDTRTRLYRMAIDQYFEELADTFEIKGVTEKGSIKFKKNIKYDAFLITRKSSKL